MRQTFLIFSMKLQRYRGLKLTEMIFLKKILYWNIGEVMIELNA